MNKILIKQTQETETKAILRNTHTNPTVVVELTLLTHITECTQSNVAGTCVYLLNVTKI